MASSASSPIPLVSDEYFRIFHTIDRRLYTILVMQLWREPVETMQIMALWLWLERMGYYNAVMKILSLPNILINELADEAIICLNCVSSDQFPSPSENDIPLLQSLMEKEISLQFFHEYRLTAMRGVNKILNEVCVRALSDIMSQAVQINTTQSVIDSQTMLQSSQQPQLPQTGAVPTNDVRGWTLDTEVPPDARTLFVTFSKGYPVREWEVREFLTRGYGDCIESLLMQEVGSNQQALFARIIFRSSNTIDKVLKGLDKVKFTINGKHVWARKYVPKRPRSPVPSLRVMPSFSTPFPS